VRDSIIFGLVVRWVMLCTYPYERAPALDAGGRRKTLNHHAGSLQKVINTAHAGIHPFDNAAISIAGIELAHRIQKRQFSLALADRAACGG